MTIFLNIDINIQSKSIFHTNDNIFTYLAYFTQIFNTSIIFTQLTIFSHIEHILHNDCYFPSRSWFFGILDFFMVLVARVRSFVG
jgi:hypothetical protein